MKRIMALVVAVGSMAAGAFEVEQVFRPERYSRGDTNVRPQQEIDAAAWVWLPGMDTWGKAIFTETRPDALAKAPFSFLRFRKDFAAIDGEDLEIDVSADERYVLLLDGKEISRGPHRGLENRWNYQSYRITRLEPGTHRIEAVCWQLGEHAPLAQITVRGGFILKASGRYDAALTTGKAAWRAAPLRNTRMTDKGNSGSFGVGSQCEVVGTSCLTEMPSDGDFRDVTVVRKPVKTWAGLFVQGWMLFPTILRDMMFELKTPGAAKGGDDLLRPGTVVPAGAHVRMLWDLGNYYCAYPFLRVKGGKGATVRWGWTECLRDAKGHKGDRASVEGVDFTVGMVDTFRPDGREGAVFTTPWWRCGRWCLIEIATADEPLTIEKVEFAETRASVEMQATFECDDPFIMSIQPLCARALQMCMHEHFFDCPYYEQQMYPGDSRVQYLVSGLFDTEDRLVRNAMTIYDCDRRDNGLSSFNCPTRGTQEGFGFACCAAIMHGDYAWQHANRGWLGARMGGLNHALMGFEDFTRADGLLAKTPGWNFVDWVPRWPDGVPPEGDSERPNAEINLQYLLALQAAVRAEESLGEPILAAHWRSRADRLSRAIKAEFWCPDRSLFASTAEKRDFSEHSQCLALLGDVVTGDEAEACFKALVETPDLDRGTIYYKHYLFETFFRFGRGDLFFKNLGFWKDCAAWHLSTILETPDTNSRSDCHGWGSHPLWHLHTGVAGVRSAAPWYEKVLVAPQPAHLKFIRSKTPTPKGMVELDLRFDGGKASGTVTLPGGLTGEFAWRGKRVALRPGMNEIARQAE